MNLPDKEERRLRWLEEGGPIPDGEDPAELQDLADLVAELDQAGEVERERIVAEAESFRGPTSRPVWAVAAAVLLVALGLTFLNSSDPVDDPPVDPGVDIKLDSNHFDELKATPEEAGLVISWSMPSRPPGALFHVEVSQGDQVLARTSRPTRSMAWTASELTDVSGVLHLRVWVNGREEMSADINVVLP